MPVPLTLVNHPLSFISAEVNNQNLAFARVGIYLYRIAFLQISAKDTLQEGAVLCIPAAVSESLYETNSATNVPKIALHDIKYLRSTILHKA